MRKKITILLVSLLCCIGVMQAQRWALSEMPSKTLNSLNDISAEKYYVLQTADEYGMNLWLKDDNTNGMIVNNQITTMQESAQTYLWKIIKTGDNYSFQNVATEKYFPTIIKDSKPSTVDAASAGTFEMIDQQTSGAGIWNIKNATDAVCLNVKG